MGKLTEWSDKQPAWARDALRRAAICETIEKTDTQAIADRVAAAEGVQITEECPCSAFEEVHIDTGSVSGEHVLLNSIGPIGHIDRLAVDQELKFGLNGITLIFGENASGKSGYARAVRRLCNARVPILLRGDVYSTNQPPAPEISFSFKPGEGELVRATWTEGAPLPTELAGMTFLDTANARVYVEGEAEILFLPAEVRCLTRLGELYAGAAAICQAKATALGQQYVAAFGGHFDATTVAGKLVARLTNATSLNGIPTEEELRAAGQWLEGDDQRLADLSSRLAQSPQLQATRLRRLAGAAQLIIANVEPSIEYLSDEAFAENRRLLAALDHASKTAQVLATAQIGGQPIAATGSDTWRELFEYARKFIEEAGVVQDDASFKTGDPCPLCQRPLDEESRDRLNAFDTFVEGQAALAVEAARNSVITRLKVLQGLSPGLPDDIKKHLAELSETGEQESTLVTDVTLCVEALTSRKTNAVAMLSEGEGIANPEWDVGAINRLRDYANGLLVRATSLDETGAADPLEVAREREMRDRKSLNGQLAEMLARRAGLVTRHQYLKCVEALNTRPVSALASKLRGEMVTPDLKLRIENELAALGLGHIPLRFHEASRAGRSFFEMALDTTRKSAKEAILSEGEQRALAIACFLADSHVAAKSGAIIVDDPVTSLDHQRIRKVAKRFVGEAAKGRQIIIFTHNLLFYQEVLRACAEHGPPVPALECLIQKTEAGFGLISVDDQPWIAKKVKGRERVLEAQLNAIPADLPTDSDEFRRLSRDFYTDLRETWERAVEEIVLGGVVERFGSDVKTQSLKGVEVSDEDYRIIFFAMKRISERSGHDQAAGRQIDTPDKAQMESDLLELRGFLATRRKKKEELESRRRKLETAPKAAVG